MILDFYMSLVGRLMLIANLFFILCFLMKRYFTWSISDSIDMTDRWDLFFKLFETFNETPIHIIEPLWPEWIRFFQEESIDFSWGQLLLMRLMSHENPHVKKFAFDSFLKSFSSLLKRISLHHKFITGK